MPNTKAKPKTVPVPVCRDHAIDVPCGARPIREPADDATTCRVWMERGAESAWCGKPATHEALP